MTSSSNSYNSTNSTPAASIPDAWETIPCVQYGFPDDEGPIRAPKLQTIFDPVPEDAATASPVYLLSRKQYDRQDRFKSGYEVTGVRSIATELQNKAEAEDKVLYPVHVESDAYRKQEVTTLIEWFREFTEDYLGVPFHTCTLYFSGRRSIHVHIPRFVSGESQREHLRGVAETFCEETGAKLDCGLYYAKRMFRLPGVKHAETGLQKVTIEPEWGKTRIIRESNTDDATAPNSYEEVLRRVFAIHQHLTADSSQATLGPPYNLFQILDSDATVLEFDPDKREVEVPLIEQEQYPEEPAEAIRWLQYNAKEFSPYALASGNSRSVAAFQPKGGAFVRDDVRDGAPLIPARFYGAQGCAGEEFTKEDEHAPLQLSTRDFQKWEYEIDDHVVIIGGRSRSSRIFQVEKWQAIVVGYALTGEDASRQAALDYLQGQGYDVGEASDSGDATSSDPAGQGHDGHVPSVQTPHTEAAALQRQAEEDGIETLTHTERWRVACRVLGRGWEPAWQWFSEQFGADFKPGITREQFRSVIRSYPDDYDHVEVPPQ